MWENSMEKLQEKNEKIQRKQKANRYRRDHQGDKKEPNGKDWCVITHIGRVKAAPSPSIAGSR